MRKLQNVNIVDREDGLHLADLAISQADRKPLREYVSISLKIPRHCALIRPRYLHLTKPRAKFTAFSVAFVTRLLRDTDLERAYSVDDAVFRELVTGFLPTFSVECRSVAKRGRSESDRQPSPVQCLMSAGDVAFLLVLLDRRDLEDEAVMLIAKLEAEAGTVDIIAFETFFLPLLEALIVWLQWTSERVARYRKLFRTTLLICNALRADRTPGRQLDKTSSRLPLFELPSTRCVLSQPFAAIDQVSSRPRREATSASDARRHEYLTCYRSTGCGDSGGDEAPHGHTGEASAVGKEVLQGQRADREAGPENSKITAGWGRL